MIVARDFQQIADDWVLPRPWREWRRPSSFLYHIAQDREREGDEKDDSWKHCYEYRF